MPEQAAAWQYRRLRCGDAADRRRSASVRRAGADVKLAVLGATGSVGRELVTQALAAGHEVTALVREQPKPGEIDDRVALVLADAKSAEAVERTVAGSDAVVSALGHAKRAPDDILAPEVRAPGATEVAPRSRYRAPLSGAARARNNRSRGGPRR